MGEFGGNAHVSRGQIAAALLNLDDDPERSILLGLEALSRTHTVEAQESLHQAIQASRIRQTYLAPGDLPTNWLTYSPDGSRIFSSGLNGSVMWDALTGGIIFTHTVANIFDYAPDYVTVEWINRDRFSPDGSLLLLPNEEWAGNEALKGTITILSATNGEELLTFAAHGMGIQDMALNLEGTQFASASFDGTIKVWDLAATLATGERQEVATPCCHDDWVYSVAFSPDGERLVTSSDEGDSTVKVWNAQTGKEIYTLVGHFGRAWGLDFSPDSTRLASSGFGGIIKVWDMTTGEEIADLKGE